MQRSTAISTVTETGCAKAAMISIATKSVISIPAITSAPTQGTRDTWASTTTSNKDIAMAIGLDTMTATPAGRSALTCTDSMIATIRTDCPAGMRITALTPSGDTLTSPWTQVIEMASKQGDKISGSARNIT